MSVNLNAVSILFIAAAYRDVGYGHLNRCLVLAEHARSNGANIHFFVLGDELASKRVQLEGYPCWHFSKSYVDLAYSDLYAEYFSSFEVVIADIIYPTLVINEDLNKLFEKLRSGARLLVAIDGLGVQSIALSSQRLSLDLVVSPYVSDVIPIEQRGWRFLKGSEYAILSNAYARLKKREHYAGRRRVLLTCGGSDPNEYTFAVLMALEGLSKSLELKVIIGPMFGSPLISKLNEFIKNSRHNTIFEFSPPVLIDQMLWCDLAISASGLTKYELAASATPSVLFSIDQHHEFVNKPFARLNTAVSLGVGVSVNAMQYEVERLLENSLLRAEMADRGKLLVDGLGAKRVLSEIKKELFC